LAIQKIGHNVHEGSGQLLHQVLRPQYHIFVTIAEQYLRVTHSIQ